MSKFYVPPGVNYPSHVDPATNGRGPEVIIYPIHIRKANGYIIGCDSLTDVESKTVSGDLVMVFPGLYDLEDKTITLTDGVDWKFEPGVEIITTADYVFTDGGNIIIVTMQGSPKLVCSSDYAIEKELLSDIGYTVNGFDVTGQILNVVKQDASSVFTDDSSYIGAGPKVSDYQTVLDVYKSDHDWWPALRAAHHVNDPADPFAHIIGTLSNASLIMTSGVFERSIEGTRNDVWINLTGTASYTNSGLVSENIVMGLHNRVRVGNEESLTQSTETIPYLVGAYNVINSEAGATSDVTNLYGNITELGIIPGGVTNAYGFYSKISSNPTNGWHFYGEGDYQTYLGGDLEVIGDVVMVPNLPITDPINAGQLWNDGGTVKISTGA